MPRSYLSVSMLHCLFVLVAALSLCASPIRAQSYAEGGVCFVFYGAPGTIDYPWSVTAFLELYYDPTPQTNANGAYLNLLDGMAYYTYTNKSGAITLWSAQEVSTGVLYVDSPAPVDSSGLSFLVAPATRRPFQSFQLPGAGPKQSFGYITLTNDSSAQGGAYVQLGAAFALDTASQAWVAQGIPGFVNRYIANSSANAANVNYTNCVAAITNSNGRVSPVSPSSANTATSFTYSYSISDGASYNVTTVLAITTAPTLLVDQLGNSYQNITAVQGRRSYTYLPTGATVTSSVTGLSTAVGLPSQRWYPFALLQSTPGVYSTATAPFVDGEGIGFSISPAQPVNGVAPGSGTQYAAITVHVAAPDTVSYPVLTEFNFVTAPLISKQQQSYVL